MTRFCLALSVAFTLLHAFVSPAAYAGPRASSQAVFDGSRTTVVGRVLSGELEPIANAHLRLTLVGGAWELDHATAPRPLSVHRAMTGSDGRFEMESVPARGWGGGIEVDARGWATQNEEVAGLSARRFSDLGDIVLRRPGSLEGRIVDDKGDPVPSADVLAVDAQRDTWLTGARGRWVATSDEEGNFRADGLSAGQVRLCVEKGSNVAYWEGPFTVLAGAVVDDVLLTSRPGHLLTGRLLDVSTNEGVEGQVTLSRYDGGRALSTRTQSDGSYVLRGFEPGIFYHFHGTAPGYRFANGVHAGALGGVNSMVITADRVATGFDVPMAAVRAIPLHVVDAETSEPIMGAEISRASSAVRSMHSKAARAASSSSLFRTDAEGHADVVAYENSPEVQVQALGYTPEVKHVVVSRKPQVGVNEVRLKRGGSLRVHVTSSGGARQVATIEVLCGGWSIASMLPPLGTRGNHAFPVVGRYETHLERGAFVPCLPATMLREQYLIRCVDPPSNSLMPVAIEEGQTSEVVFKLGEGSTLSGRVSPRREHDVVMAVMVGTTEFKVAAVDGFAFVAPVDDEGQYAFHDMPPGSYRLSVRGQQPGQRQSDTQRNLSRNRKEQGKLIEIRDAEPMAVDLVGYAPGGSVEGNLRVNGRVTGHRSMRAVWQPDQERNTPEHVVPARQLYVDHRGQFVVSGLEPGNWSLWLESSSSSDLGVAVGKLEFEVRQGETTQLDADIKVASLSVRVASRAPTESIWVRGRRTADGRRFHWRSPWAVGDAVLIAELPAGDYTVGLGHGPSPDLDISLTAGEHRVVSIPAK